MVLAACLAENKFAGAALSCESAGLSATRITSTSLSSSSQARASCCSAWVATVVCLVALSGEVASSDAPVVAVTVVSNSIEADTEPRNQTCRQISCMEGRRVDSTCMQLSIKFIK